MAMQPPGSDPSPQRSLLAQLLMSIFNQGQPFGGGQQGGGSAGNAGMFPAAPGSGMSGLFPAAPAGPPTDMSVAGPWGAGIDPATTGGTAAPVTPQEAPTPSPRPGPSQIGKPQNAPLRAKDRIKGLNRGQY